MIRLRDFSIGYGPRRLLGDVECEIHSDSLSALIGRNGSGKSTLLRALAGLKTDYTGEILVDGLPLRGMDTRRRSRTIAFVNTARARVADMRCFDAVAVGRAPYTGWTGRLAPADMAAVTDALEAVGMAEYADRTLDTLSDGECQRVMIARALAQDTPVLLLDEPTSFLDLPNRYELVRLLSRLARERHKTVVISTHELEIALRLADTILLIDPPRLLDIPAPAAAPVVSRIFNLPELGGCGR